MADGSKARASCLWVPIHVEALVVNQPVVQGTPFQRWQMNYANLAHLQNPTPAPFQALQGPPPQGVHLHWALPDALTHGHKREGSAGADFPLVPNRWLVVRWRPEATPTAGRQVRAWVLESDYLDPSSGSNPYLQPWHPQPVTRGNVATTRLGRSSPLDAWAGEPASPAPLFLTAVGPGDMTFAAFAPGVQDVFAFHDDTTTLPTGTALTYLVLGWYSDPSEDPLYGKSQYGTDGWTTTAQWQALLQALRWSVVGPVDSPPRQCVLHGMVYGVTWQTTALPERVFNQPEDIAPRVQVAVGHTAIDALAALLQHAADQTEAGSMATLLEAFQYHLLDTLDQPDGLAQLEQSIHQAWFGAVPGGVVWEIVAAEHTESTAPPARPPLTAAQTAWLAQLNTQQRQLDQAQRALRALQWELYAMWWKHALLQTGYRPQYPPENFATVQQAITDALAPDRAHNLLSTVIAQQRTVAQLASALPDPHDAASICHYAQSLLSDTLVLKPHTMPRFWHPNDPVVLVAGLERAHKHGEDGRDSADGTLLCRLSGQTIQGLTIDATTITPAMVQEQLPPLAHPHIPTQVSDLCLEALFVDPTNAASLARDGLHSTDTASISRVAAAITAQTGVLGMLPAPFAVLAWAQAWSPLFLEWQVQFSPTVQQDDNGQWHFDAQGWQLHGQDYEWTGGDPANDASRSYAGRTFVTPQVASNFSARLQQYLQDHPRTDLQHLAALQTQISQWDVLSQSLSGLTSQLILRNVSQHVPPDPSVAAAVGEQDRGAPDVYAGDVDTAFGGAPPSFFPIRAGFWRFEKLQIVDCFGQVVDLLWANGNVGGRAETFTPWRGRGLVPGSGTTLRQPERMMMLAPRLVQPSRLDFRWVSAERDQDEVGLVAGVTPLCGWLLPNHLDQGLAVYDAQGQMLGELLLRGDTVDWQPAPHSPMALTTPDAIANPHLRGVVAGLVNRGDQAAALQNFLQVIDETLWTVNPLGERGDQHLAVLIGRPLAVVRASVSWTLDGLPVANPSWATTVQQDNGDVTTIPFVVRLGNRERRDDGLVGYYVGDTYQQCYTVHTPEALSPATPPYVLPMEQDAHALALPHDQGRVVYLTLLLDPRGSVHARTGLVPTKTLTLPDGYFTEALGRMAVTFRAGPLLLNPQEVRLPRPTEQHGTWSWVQRTSATAWTEMPVVNATPQAHLTDVPLTLAAGWLKLSRVQEDDSRPDTSTPTVEEAKP